MCQKLNFISAVCDSSCDGRCFGKEQDECCHPECAGGCVGPGREQCLACKNFYFEGSCHSYCPRMKMFDPSTHQVVNNPDGRYAFGSLCVKDCPPYLVKENDACVIECPAY
ncbi:EGFR-like protein, partial [Mya arenaria]